MKRSVFSYPLLFLGCTSIFLPCCSPRISTDVSPLISLQTIDRNGFSETISAKDRIAHFSKIDFLHPQPYQKVLRVFRRNSTGKSPSEITSYHPNGHIWQQLQIVDGRAHGYYREWHPNGKQKIEAHVIEGLAEVSQVAQSSWVFEEKSCAWDEDGDIAAEFYYEKGMLHGISYMYHKNGKMKKSLPYFRDTIHGLVQCFDVQGLEMERISYENGRKHGLATGGSPDQSWFYDEEYQNGKLITGRYSHAQFHRLPLVENGEGFQTLFTDGRPEALVEICNGLPEGSVRLFRSDGSVRGVYHLQGGKKHGEEWEYYPSPPPQDPLQKPECPKILTFWQEDILQGITRTWYPHGVLESQREMSQNKRNGSATAYYKDGTLMFIEEYHQDKLEKGVYYKKQDNLPVSRIDQGKGTATLFDGDGHFLRKIPYDRGEPLLRSE